MPAAILATKLYLPAPRPGLVSRPQLVERLNAGLAAGRKLTLLSTSAGFGKTTLLSEWISAPPRPPGDGDQAKLDSGARACWLSLDDADSDLPRFLVYLVAALQTLQPALGEALLSTLQTPQPPPAEALLTGLLNEIAALPQKLIIVLDDYHLLDSQGIDQALTFFVDHLPPQLHLVIASREDPNLPLPRLRARGQLTELRTADLRFTPAEAAEFLNRVMGLNLAEGDVAAIEARTEGWIAGLQLAALAMQGEKDAASASPPSPHLRSPDGGSRRGDSTCAPAPGTKATATWLKPSITPWPPGILIWRRAGPKPPGPAWKVLSNLLRNPRRRPPDREMGRMVRGPDHHPGKRRDADLRPGDRPGGALRPVEKGARFRAGAGFG